VHASIGHRAGDYYLAYGSSAVPVKFPPQSHGVDRHSLAIVVEDNDLQEPTGSVGTDVEVAGVWLTTRMGFRTASPFGAVVRQPVGRRQPL
jgi:hypothetical protein